MTSSPAPDLDELERLHVIEEPEYHVETNRHCDSCWEDWPCAVALLVTELRAARAAAAESGRLREALRELTKPGDWLALAGNPGFYRPVLLFSAEHLARLRALLATPPAPSDHGALAPERLTAAIMAAVGASHPDDFGIAYRERGFSPAGLAAAVFALLSDPPKS